MNNAIKYRSHQGIKLLLSLIIHKPINFLRPHPEARENSFNTTLEGGLLYISLTNTHAKYLKEMLSNIMKDNIDIML